MDYNIVDKYENNGYTITVRIPKMTEAEKIQADINTFKRLKSVVQSFQVDKSA